MVGKIKVNVIFIYNWKFYIKFNISSHAKTQPGRRQGGLQPPPTKKERREERGREEERKKKKEKSRIKRERKLNKSFQEHVVIGLWQPPDPRQPPDL